jgi:alpha-galactosidase
MVGAGSMTFSRGLMADAVQCEALQGATLALYDIEFPRAELMAAVGGRYAQFAGADVSFEAAPSLSAALDGASFVTCTIAVGGMDAWVADLEVPEQHGSVQTVGDSVGPGGISRGLRHVPVVVEVAREMERLCPDAWLLNYTNPMSCLCIAVRRETPVNAVGLCHGLFGTVGRLAELLDMPREELYAEAAGINHLTWITTLQRDGEDIYPLLRERLATEEDLPQPVSAKLCEVYGLYPSPGDTHVAEFFPHFLGGAGDDGRRWGLKPIDLEERAPRREELADQLRAVAAGDEAVEKLPQSGEKAVAIMAAMLEDKGELHVVNLPNRGAIAGLPDDAIVEVTGLVSATGMRTIQMPALPEGILGVLRAWVDRQELTTEAALTGDQRLALQALLADPLVPSVEAAEAMLDGLLSVHSAYLPEMWL